MISKKGIILRFIKEIELALWFLLILPGIIQKEKIILEFGTGAVL